MRREIRFPNAGKDESGAPAEMSRSWEVCKPHYEFDLIIGVILGPVHCVNTAELVNLVTDTVYFLALTATLALEEEENLIRRPLTNGTFLIESTYPLPP